MASDTSFASAWTQRLPGAEPADALLLLVCVPLAGRVWLACLPPGLPGRHAPRDLPATWAASLLLGSVGLATASALAGSSSTVFFWLALGVPAFAAIVLRALGPAALVPRHEPEPLPASLVGRALVAAASLAAAVLAGWRGDASAAVTALATVSLASAALAWARVTVFVRAPALAAIAVAVGLLPGRTAEGPAALGAAGAAAGIVLWIRRGDRRGLALVAGSLAYLAISEPQGWASAIAIAWVVATCSVGGTRWRALAWVASGLALGIAIRSLDGECDRWCCSRDELTIPAELGLIVALVATSLAAAALSVRRGAPAWDPSGAPRARETIVLALTAVATLVVSFAGNDHPSDPIPLGFPDVSAASASFWVQASLFAAIAVARAFEAPSRSA